MSRVKAQDNARSRQRSASYRVDFNHEIDQRIAQIRERISQVQDLTVDGFPYKDSERVRLELQIRQSIRHAFGDGSPEFQKHQYFRLKAGTDSEVDSTVSMLLELIKRLEKQKFDLPDDGTRSANGSGTTVSEEGTHESSAMPPSHAAPAQTACSADSREKSAAPPLPLSDETPVAPPTAPPAAPDAVADEISARSDASGKSSPARTAEAEAVSDPGAAVAAAPESSLQPTLGTGPHEAAIACETVNQPSSSNGLPARPVGDSPMISSHKLRHDGNETSAREPRPEPWASSNGSALSSLRKLCTGFHSVARQLRQRHEDRPTLDVEDEHDVQDLVHALLRMEFGNIRTEHWVPGYAGGAERTTFLFAEERLALVIKRTKPGLGGREIKAQLDIDAQRYSGRPDCETLFCFVYDPEGRIANPREFEASLSQEGESGSIAVQISP